MNSIHATPSPVAQGAPASSERLDRLLFVGRRLRHDLVPGEVGVVVKIRPALGVGGMTGVSGNGQDTFDVVWGNGSWREKMAAGLLLGGSCELLPGAAPPDEVNRLRSIYLAEKLKSRVATGAGAPPASAAAARVPTWGAPPPGAWGRRAQPRAEEAHPREAAMQIRVRLAQRFPEVDFRIRVKGESVKICWVDGPITVHEVTDPYLVGSGSGRTELAKKIRLERELSDELVESAIEFARQAVDRKDPSLAYSHPDLTPDLYRNGSMRDIYPRSPKCDAVSYGALTRLVLMRWDDAAGVFVESQAARAMLIEHEMLFGRLGMEDAGELMRRIRIESMEALADRPAAERDRPA